MHFIPDVPIILCGTNSSARITGSSMVTVKQGMQLKKQIGAVKYIECSSEDLHSVKTVFLEAIRVAQKRKLLSDPKRKKGCIIM
jgi:Ras-related C3 botulinum toxin substrate 1